MTRVLFMGTPDFSVPSLATLVSGPYDIVGVVTQPDRPGGRGRKLRESPVKYYARQEGMVVLQPQSLRNPEAVADLARLAPEVIVVAAFGQILRPALLNLAAHGCINVHASLLPRWRGAAPVQAAILAGDQVTGSTIMLMDEHLDTGPLLAQAAMPIRDDDTGATLTDRLAHHGAGLLGETLPRWLAGEINPQEQEETLATICRPLRKKQGCIDWRKAAAEIALAIRAYYPWPAAFTTYSGQPLKVLSGRADQESRSDRPAGTVIRGPDGIGVVTGEGVLILDSVQPAGKRAMPVSDFVRGRPGFLGARLGDDGCS
ncbi:MAG: methionyl-tRNA formyltransferase [Chloroflexota bacterium]|nr:methionyl-tRNA formyltransferase [Chloroflexota bacterium]